MSAYKNHIAKGGGFWCGASMGEVEYRSVGEALKYLHSPHDDKPPCSYCLTAVVNLCMDELGYKPVG